MTPAELQQFQRETFARAYYGRAYRLARSIAKGDTAAIRERDALARNGGHGLLHGAMAYSNRLASDPLRRPLRLRQLIRGCAV